MNDNFLTSITRAFRPDGPVGEAGEIHRQEPREKASGKLDGAASQGPGTGSSDGVTVGSLGQAAVATGEVLGQVRRTLADAVLTIYRSSVMHDDLQGEARELVRVVLEHRIALTERIEAVDHSCVELQGRLAEVCRRLEPAGQREPANVAATGGAPEFPAEAWAEYYLVRMAITARQWQLEHVVDELRVLLAIVGPTQHGPAAWPAAHGCGLDRTPATAKPGADPTPDWPERLAALDALFHADCRRAVALRRLGRARAAADALESLAASADELHREIDRRTERGN